ncbi:MAG: CRTAC1 family protein [Planctomycetota bacterium]
MKISELTSYLSPLAHRCQRANRRATVALFTAALCVGAISAPAGAQGPTAEIAFTRATTASGIRFGLRPAPPLVGLLPTEQTRYGAGSAAGDYDNDGDLDLYLVAHGGAAGCLYRNNGDGTFTDVTQAAELGALGFGHMAMFLDLDNDRFDDLCVFNDSVSGGAAPFSTVYRNIGGVRFERVVDSGLFPTARTLGGATAGDYDRDGKLDLYIVSWFDSRNYLYRNEGHCRFRDVTGAAQLLRVETLVEHWSPLFFDANGDGWPDLFCGVDFAEDYLFLNQQNGTFGYVDMAYSIGNDMGLAAGDFDNDGDTDLYTTNITAPTDPAGCCNWLYVNDGAGQFTNQAGARGIVDTGWGWGTSFFDADLDGDLDLLAVSGWQQPEWQTPARFFVNDGTGHYTEGAAAANIAHTGNTRGLLVFDADRDQDLDVLVQDVHGKAQLYRNDTPRAGRHALSVRLIGRESNSNGVGARIEAVTGGLTQMREIVAGGSFFTGVPLEAHFGLGAAAQVDELRIHWPNGRLQILRAVAADRLLTVIEDD